MPRKKRRIITILSILLLLLITTVILVFLYINTDMLKSNSILFVKYMGQNSENLGEICNKIGKSDYNDLLQQNKYTTETQVKVNYTENVGTSLESTQNSINQLKLKIKGQTDKNNQYNYQDINLLNNDKKVSEIEYIQSENIYGIKFSDLFNQYILVNNGELKELLKNANFAEEALENVPDKIKFEDELESVFLLSKEEEQNIKTKYINIIIKNISEDNFSREKNQIIQIDGKDIKANAYVLTITKEQLNNIYIKMLEEVKQDEIILSRIDKLQNLVEKYQKDGTINFREKFEKYVEDTITEIAKNNIGQEVSKIMVYESGRTTVRTKIQAPNHEICIDLMSYQSEEYVKISYQDNNANHEEIFTYRKTEEETSAILKRKKSGETTEYNLQVSEKADGNHCKKNTIAKYEDSSKRIEATIEQQINIVNSFENEVVLNNQNSINLSNLAIEQIKAVWDRVNEGVTEKINEITTDWVKTDDLWEVLKAIGLVEEEQVLQVTGITETERNRFNSKFEILQGDNLESAAILKLIDAIKENFIDIEMVSNTELKLKLDRFNKNEKATETLSSFVEERKNKKYNAKVEYDETTGLASSIVLTMLEK